MLTPECCKYAKLYITLRYETYWIDDDDCFTNNKPLWTIRGSKLPQDIYRFITLPIEAKKISFCPACGTKLPDIKLKQNISKDVKFTTINDGGYYCNTCSQRLNECTCLPPTEMWELKGD